MCWDSTGISETPSEVVPNRMSDKHSRLDALSSKARVWDLLVGLRIIISKL